MGVRREFRKVALSTQAMAPDTVFSLFFIPGSLGAKDGENVLWLKLLGDSDVTGITFACLCQFQELAWIRRALPGSHR